mmetsp:Transcript_24979/g.69937  ORF Transcript_24979/g.69937 Transcript_24979/m.69937 type:complete len:141 (+) Transcript_24979:105-527(+)
MGVKGGGKVLQKREGVDLRTLLKEIVLRKQGGGSGVAAVVGVDFSRLHHMGIASRKSLGVYVSTFLECLLRVECHVVLVMDAWRAPPAKWPELRKRREKRQKALEEALELMRKVNEGGKPEEVEEWSKAYLRNMNVVRSG